MLRKTLIGCGIVGTLLWIFGDFSAAMRYEGYSMLELSVSELSAIGAPTRPYLLALLFIDNLFMLAFSVGIWLVAGEKRGLRIAAALQFVLGILSFVVGIINFFRPFAAMHTREELATAGASASTDTMHLVFVGITVLVILLSIGFASGAFGRKWRVFSWSLIALMLIFGLWTSLDANRVAANLPTPWLGLRERVNVYAYYIWVLALAVALLPWATAPAAKVVPPARVGPPRLTPR